uniref:Uncharacterized protein n=1 Tax=Aegilops tauschii subsp. strangulata TaxID=200361 RepID=A0A452YYU3_AEGTS
QTKKFTSAPPSPRPGRQTEIPRQPRARDNIWITQGPIRERANRSLVGSCSGLAAQVTSGARAR